MATGFDRFRGVLGLVIAGSLASMALIDPAVAWFAVPAVIGGALVAGALYVTHKSHRLNRLEEVTDTSDSAATEGINMATLAPAGIGGIGLGVMAIVAATRYPEGRFLITATVVGGLAIAATLIRLRRQAPVPVTRRRVLR